MINNLFFAAFKMDQKLLYCISESLGVLESGVREDNECRGTAKVLTKLLCVVSRITYEKSTYVILIQLRN